MITDDELLKIYGRAKRDFCYEGPIDDWPKRAERAATLAGLRAVIEQTRPAQVPVSEQPWKWPGWCDAEGRCWFGFHEFKQYSGNSGDFDICPGEWVLLEAALFSTSCMWTVSLPHWAIPLPDDDHFPDAREMVSRGEV